MPKLIDLTDRRFSRWYVRGPAPTAHKQRRWVCVCDCGTVAVVHGGNLRNGTSTSCGCYEREQARARKTTHGQNGTRVHRIWKAMRSRCSNKNTPAYPYYGGRGVTVCERWQVFAHFLADMGQPPSDAHSLDRIDTDGAYTPENCRWVDVYTQANNKRNNTAYTFNGVTQNAASWARHFGLIDKTFIRLARRGWSAEMLAHYASLDRIGRFRMSLQVSRHTADGRSEWRNVSANTCVNIMPLQE